MVETRVCKQCGESKPLTSFGKTGRGGLFRRHTCYTCKKQADFISNPRKHTNRNHYQSDRRKKFPARSILLDCRYADKKAGFGPNDLDLLFVESSIKDGCTYCGEVALRMSLDRIDNNQGHSKANVIACCVRCNYMRGSMPYEAWLHLVPAVRSARCKGLFGLWRSQPTNQCHTRTTWRSKRRARARGAHISQQDANLDAQHSPL